MVKTVGKYDLYGTLGEGAFGKVKYAVNTETNEAVAIKILDKDKIQSRNMGAQIKKEISIMKMINHHHVVGVKDVFATSAKIFIVLEFVGGGELFDKIANEGKLPEEKARFYFKQLVEGLEHCHQRGICHRDLKPENLLLDTDGNLKISDFGFSTLNIGDADGDGTARAELLHTTCGTPNYVAPEVLGKDGYDGMKADVWSCGVILYVLLAGYLPFDENTMAALFQKIKAADYEFPDWFTPDAKDLISRILVPDPQKRPKLTDLKPHPWMQKGDSGPTPITNTTIAAAQGAPPTINNPGPGGVAPRPSVTATTANNSGSASPSPAATPSNGSTGHGNGATAPAVAPVAVPAAGVTAPVTSTKSAEQPAPVAPIQQQQQQQHTHTPPVPPASETTKDKQPHSHSQPVTTSATSAAVEEKQQPPQQQPVVETKQQQQPPVVEHKPQPQQQHHSPQPTITVVQSTTEENTTEVQPQQPQTQSSQPPPVAAPTTSPSGGNSPNENRRTSKSGEAVQRTVAKAAPSQQSGSVDNTNQTTTNTHASNGHSTGVPRNSVSNQTPTKPVQPVTVPAVEEDTGGGGGGFWCCGSSSKSAARKQPNQA